MIRRGIWTPTVFSPNGDAVNDWFYPTVVDDSYQSIRFMTIYNRWGNKFLRMKSFNRIYPLKDGMVSLKE
ncbi:MAG: gliding motility-associated C-terminal domain-containing protein [Saprospiraceae bacterium]|nr:gliding motility-associated C-terminal domain-containing protein [Saprospiraceae bacterium]